MEGEINPLDGKGEWESLDNKKIFSAFWKYIKHINILEYERNFVVNYEDLISAEGSVNNYYKGLMELLHDEMIVTEEDYKIKVL